MYVGEYESIENNNKNLDILSEFIFVNISVGLIRTNNMRKDIDELYNKDPHKYYDAALKSNAKNHIIVTKGLLEQNINSRKVLGMILIAERDSALRNKLIKLLRKYYPLVYSSVKQMKTEELTIRYLHMDEVARKIEKRIESAIYLYLVKYCSVNRVDKEYVHLIMEDIKQFEFYSPMSMDIVKEITNNKGEINKIIKVLENKYGKIQNYKDILYSKNDYVDGIAGILENFFIINKIDVNEFFSDSKNFNIEKMILAYIKRGYKYLEQDIAIQSIIYGVFIQALLEEYKKSKEIYFKNSQEEVALETSVFKKKIKEVEDENEKLKEKIKILEERQLSIEDRYKNEISRLNKNYKTELIDKDKIIKTLENKLQDEAEYRIELNLLREHTFKLKNEYIPKVDNDKLENYIENKQILIVGGTREWRRRLKDKYSKIKTLNGFNDNFELSILSNIDYIFFYTGYMSHSTYNRVISFIRNNDIKFGYIGKTNMELVEEELIEELQKCCVARKINP